MSNVEVINQIPVPGPRKIELLEKFHLNEDKVIELEGFRVYLRPNYSALETQFSDSDLLDKLVSGGELIKGKDSEKYDEGISLVTGDSFGTIICKKVEETKTGGVKKKEYLTLIAIDQISVNEQLSALQIAYVEAGTAEYTIMESVKGLPATKFVEKLESGKISEVGKRLIIESINAEIQRIVSVFRRRLKLDKRWYLKDWLIDFDWQSMSLVKVTPIDWERVKNYDPDKPLIVEKIIIPEL